MSWLASFGIGIINAIIGVFGVGTLGALCVEWYRISGREAGSAYFVIFLGLLGGLVGFSLGLAGARILASGTPSGFFQTLAIISGGSIGLLSLATLICWLAADLDTTLRGKPVQLEAEIRCPAGFVTPPDATDEHWYAHIDTRTRRVTSRAALRLNDARQENGRLIIPMTLPLATSVREKLLYVRLAENVQLFIPRFPSKPGSRFFSWSDWQDGGWDPDRPRPEPARRFNFRFRLQIKPSAESGADQEVKKQAAQAVALAALTPESSLEQSLALTHYSHPEDQRLAAGAIIGRRPEVVAEISAQILSTDIKIADRALRSLAYIKPLPPELAPPVAAVGDRLIAEIEKFNATDPAADQNYYKGAKVASTLFAGWMEGHQALHEIAGTDGLPQLQKVLDLSLKREDSHVMKDIARIVNFYATKWAAGPATK